VGTDGDPVAGVLEHAYRDEWSAVVATLARRLGDLQAAEDAAAEAFAAAARVWPRDGTPPNPGGWPKGGVTRLTLPNNHLQYAITWFSLAVALMVIYFLFHRRDAGTR